MLNERKHETDYDFNPTDADFDKETVITGLESEAGEWAAVSKYYVLADHQRIMEKRKTEAERQATIREELARQQEEFAEK